MRLILPFAAGALVAGALMVVALRAQRRRRRAHAIPELNQHPERLDEMLDSTDDA